MTAAHRAHVALLSLLAAFAPGCDGSEPDALHDAGEAIGEDTDAASSDAGGDAAEEDDDPRWGCLNDAPRADAPAQLAFTLAVTSAITGKAAEGLEVYACGRADLECTSPLAGPFSASADDVVSFTLDGVPAAGFSGFLRFTAPDFMPLDLYFARPVVEDFTNVGSLPLPMQLPGAITGIAATAGREVDATATAFVETYLHDCQGQPASGLRLAAAPAPEELLFTISKDIGLRVGGEATDARGTAGLINVPAGPQTIQVIEAASGRVLHQFEIEARAATHAHAYVP
jgi:hypothetical protein